VGLTAYLSANHVSGLFGQPQAELFPARCAGDFGYKHYNAGTFVPRKAVPYTKS
jgi:hypothetical protein